MSTERSGCNGPPHAQDPLHWRRIQQLAEAAHLAYQERDNLLSDPAFVDIPVDRLLSPEYTDTLVSRVSSGNLEAGQNPGTFPEHADTVYLAVVDSSGNCASFINSIFEPFGSGLMAPESGVMLHNRGSGFRLAPAAHLNIIEGGKRPLHTIIPGIMKRGDSAAMPFGVMGGHFQPVGHAWVLGNMLEYGLDSQEAIDLPRAFPFNGEIQFEHGFDSAAVETLAKAGYRVRWTDEPHGGGQAIWRDAQSGRLVAGSDPRKDGMAMGY
jgi:gamma-glutamyltranspeptidase/glutathione hydrolase